MKTYVNILDKSQANAMFVDKMTDPKEMSDFIESHKDDPNKVLRIITLKDGSIVFGVRDLHSPKDTFADFFGGAKSMLVRTSDGEYHAQNYDRFNKAYKALEEI